MGVHLLGVRAGRRWRQIIVTDSQRGHGVEQVRGIPDGSGEPELDDLPEPGLADERTVGVRPRLGFRPTSPQQEAGIRIEPAPSLPCAIGIAPAATSAAAPPLDPPTPRSQSQGLRVGP